MRIVRPFQGSRLLAVERQQLAENIVVGDVGRPTVRRGDGGVKGGMRIGEPLRASVVEVRQGTLLERPRRVLVAWNRTLWVAGNRLIDPLDPLGPIQPPVAQLDQPLSSRATATGRQLALDVDIRFLSVVNVDQFYGIEIGEFPARIAATALWMMDHIMNNRLSLEFSQTYARIPNRSLGDRQNRGFYRILDA